MPVLSMEWEWVEPIKVFREARGIPGCVFLDSGGAIGPLSRWSALAVRPLEVIEARVGEGLAAGTSLCDPFERLGALHRRWRQRARLSADGGDIVEEPRSDESDLPAFTGGVVSLLGYDAGRVVERLPAIAQDDPSLPDLWAAVYDGAIVFDRLLRRLYATSWRLDGLRRLAELRKILDLARGGAREAEAAEEARGPAVGARPGCCEPDPPALEVDRDETRERFLAGVSTIRGEIARGEIYQANLTRRLVRPVGAGSGPRIYERLRGFSPTPFGAYVDAGTFELLSASPERFLRIDRGMVETRPIKGTRRRGRDAAEDASLRSDLLASPKDRAELLMIVDLERNDIGRNCSPGTVEVGEFPALETYSTVSHLVATVRGRLRPGVHQETVLRGAFPGGSITGAPKIRAMQILEDLEPHRRKFAMGSLIAWDLGGSLDSSILIRTLVIREGEAVFNVGAGIVADSVPEDEYAETVAKAAPLTAALRTV